MASESKSQQRGEDFPEDAAQHPLLSQGTCSKIPKARWVWNAAFPRLKDFFWNLLSSTNLCSKTQHPFHQGGAGPREIFHLETLSFVISKMLFTSPAPKELRYFLAVVQLQSNKPQLYARVFIYSSQLNSPGFTSLCMMFASKAVISSAFIYFHCLVRGN